MNSWTNWIAFPDPRNFGVLVAPYGPGVYDLRNKATDELVLIGMGSNCANRMSSILPKPLGCGARKNSAKRQYVFEHLGDIEYRCLPCSDSQHAKQIERQLLANHNYIFST